MRIFGEFILRIFLPSSYNTVTVFRIDPIAKSSEASSSWTNGVVASGSDSQRSLGLLLKSHGQRIWVRSLRSLKASFGRPHDDSWLIV